MYGSILLSQEQDSKIALLCIIVSQLLWSHEVLACYGLTINGPSPICPGGVYTYNVNNPQEITCTGGQSSAWYLSGDAVFVDPNNHSSVLGTIIYCGEPGTPCPGVLGPVAVKAGANGMISLHVELGCTGIGTATNTLNVSIGLPAPTVYGAVQACVGNAVTMTATNVPGWVSYTWTVPNSSWLINGVPGPSVTLQPPSTVYSIQNPTITPGTGGNWSVFARANPAGCVGTFASAPLTVYSSAPATLTGFTGPLSGCPSQQVSFSANTTANAYTYQLEISDLSLNPIATVGSATPSWNFNPQQYVDPGNYKVRAAGINTCGGNWTSYRSFKVNASCGGGGGGCGGGPCLRASPIPAQSSLNIALQPTDDEAEEENFQIESFKNRPFDLRIISATTGKLVYHQTHRDKKFVLNTIDFPDDTYIIEAKSEKISERVKVIVKH